MKVRYALVAAALALAVGAPAATAGVTYDNYQVSISGNWMRGSIADARNSPDNVQYLGCDVYAPSSGSAVVGCYWKTAAGTSGGCTTSLPAHLQAIAAINEDSAIEITWSGGSCNTMYVRNISWFAPK